MRLTPYISAAVLAFITVYANVSIAGGKPVGITPDIMKVTVKHDGKGRRYYA